VLDWISRHDALIAMGRDYFCQKWCRMAVILLLFFAINPIYCITLGIFAGKHIKVMWSLPVIAVVLFCLAHGYSLIRVKAHS